ERIAFMLDDTAARLVITNTSYVDRLCQLDEQQPRPVLAIEQLPLDNQPAHNPVTPTTSADLAYAIYTSGTTGQPKAVLIRHGNVASFHSGLATRYFGDDRGPRQAVLFLANYVFDFSIEQMALSILSGHTLIVPPTLPIFDDEFYEYLNRHRLTYISGTPTYVQQFDLSRLPHLQLVLVAGEAFQPHHFDKIRREYAGLLLNAYGTTETSVYNTVRRFEPDEAYRNALGAPLPNTRLYVLGSDLQLLPTGAVGELFIAGECVGAGYLNRPELTHERFIANPFQTEDERRAGQYAAMYKTGDVVRRRVDGEIEFLGRNDTQVKINGLRVELGEVEAAIAAYPGVRQCAVVPQDDTRLPGSKRLVGYYVADDAATVDEDQIVAFLRAQLIPAIVPAMLVRVDGSLPMTINGKLDTEALPIVDFSAERSGYVAPRSRLESRLCQIWSRLLPGGAIGVEDDFFRAGGDSITALQLVSEMQRELKQKVSVKSIFDYPTVRSFVENALGAAPEARSEGEQGPLTGSCPLLPIQEWFFAKPLVAPNHWNQYFAIRTPALDHDRLREALDRLFDHHDAFRLRFRPSDNAGKTVEQFYSDDRSQVTLHTLDVQGLSSTEIERQLDAWQSGFDLERGPLHGVAYLHGFADGSARVWIAMHHLIVDTVSWRILAQDLEILYNGGDLGPRSSSYRQWTQALRSYTPAPGETKLWAEVAQDVAAERERMRATTASSTESYRARFALGQQETQTLFVGSNRAYDTQINDLLLTAVGFALRAVTRQTTNYVMVEGHGREEFAGAPDVRDTVGWFTTMHPVPIEVGEDLGRSIEATKASRRRVPHNGIGYGALRGVYGSAEAPIPATSFNYLGRFDAGSAAEQPLAPHEVARWSLDMTLSGVSRAPDDQHTSDCAIDVTMSAVGGQLVVEIDSRLAEADTERFSAELKSRLEAIIAHTATVAAEINARTQRFTTGVAPRADEFDPYILVNEHAAGPVLFVLPPGEGGAESYLNNLAKQLPGIRLVLFNNVHLHRPMHSFEDIAQYYLTYVRQIQPAGPYNFLGWSFGGVLSLEMAVQLTRAGEHIENLILIDSLFNVKQAAAAIGLRELEAVIDPINERYTPTAADLERLRTHTGTILLFKATQLDATFKGENQREFFEYYAQSPYNNLDTLLPAESLSVESLGEDTHFSWVYNTSLVASISSRIRALVLGSR
ncbi:MAG TPA: amino acid adenylation domain-containing protein, partial [Herpetosiphonaceae bacterium]